MEIAAVVKNRTSKEGVGDETSDKQVHIGSGPNRHMGQCSSPIFQHVRQEFLSRFKKSGEQTFQFVTKIIIIIITLKEKCCTYDG